LVILLRLLVSNNKCLTASFRAGTGIHLITWLKWTGKYRFMYMLAWNIPGLVVVRTIVPYAAVFFKKEIAKGWQMKD